MFSEVQNEMSNDMLKNYSQQQQMSADADAATASKTPQPLTRRGCFQFKIFAKLYTENERYFNLLLKKKIICNTARQFSNKNFANFVNSF